MATLTNGPRAETPQPTAPTPGYAASAPQATKGTGWLLFAGIMLMVSAVLNVIWGLAALASSGFFVGSAHYILLTNLHAWGWVAIGFGAVEFLAVLSIARGRAFGRWFGIIAASLAIVPALMSMPAYPFWSLTLVAIYVLIVYGLAAYGGRPELTR